MLTISAALMLLSIGQNVGELAHDPRVKAIAPFVGSDVIAVVQLDLSRADLPGLASRLFGEKQPGVIIDVKRIVQAFDALRRAGAKELYVVYDAIDIPGLPFVVVPLVEGANAAEIGRLLHGGGTEPSLVRLPTSAKVHNAVFAGTTAALERVRFAPAALRPELSVAFAAAGDETCAARLLFLPSADSRRVLEEMLPNFPAKLGGGPITDLTRGALWAAIGLDVGPRPALRLVAEAQDANAARAIERLGRNCAELLGRSPEVLRFVPELPKIMAELKPEVTSTRVTLRLDAKSAASLIDSASGPVLRAATYNECYNNEKRIGLAIHNYLANAPESTFPPAYSHDQIGTPLLSWRVLILPYLDAKNL
jgi:hypothetical protein